MTVSTAKTWHFLDSGANDGAYNMALDETLARSQSLMYPILRLYRWKPHTLSIGYNQNLSDIDTDECRCAGIGLVRRPTGGKAILHAHEVTYSIVIPGHSVWYTKRPLELYNQISSAIITGLQAIGLPAALKKAGPSLQTSASEKREFACFATSARYEIQYDSRKLVGSAQRRFKNAVLQHGSLLLGQAHLDIARFLSVAKENRQQSRSRLNSQTTCLETILGRKICYEEVVPDIKSGFEQFFGIRFEALDLSEAEQSLLERLKCQYLDYREAA